MTSGELQEASERNWLRVDAAVRDRCVWRLREVISPEDRARLRAAFEDGGWPPGFHFFSGMGIRNALRGVARDEELPEVHWEHVQTEDGSPHMERNWDDFYMAALRQAVAPREGEV